MTTYESGSTVTSRSNGLAVAGMVCGVVVLLLFNVILSPLAIIFGGIGLARANRGAAHHHMAVAGVVLGIIDIAIFVVMLVAASHSGGTVYFHVG
jgi:hypothetical protein